MLDCADIFEIVLHFICPSAPYKDGAGYTLCSVARVCTIWRNGIAAKLTQ